MPQEDRIPLLGEIATAGLGQAARGFADETWEGLDRQWQRRWDYALLRRLVVTTPPPQFEIPPFEVCVEEGLASVDPEQVWGVVVILAVFLTGKAEDDISSLQRDWATSLLEERLKKALPPIAEARRACALVRLLALSAVDQMRFAGGALSASVGDLEELVNDVEKLILQIDGRWRPGRWVSLQGLKKERRLFVAGFSDLAMRLGSALFCFRGAIRMACGTLLFEEGMDDLLRKAAQFAFSAWRIAHRRRDRATDRAVEFEIRALQRASQAARDAGDLMTSGRLAALLLYTIPIKDRGRFVPLANALAADIRELGLMVPSWYAIPPTGNAVGIQAVVSPPLEPIETPGSPSPEPIETHSSPIPDLNEGGIEPSPNHSEVFTTSSAIDEEVIRASTPPIDPFQARTAWETKTDPDWLLVEELTTTLNVTGQPLRRLRRLALAIRRKQAITKVEVEALLRLLCRYRRVASLFAMLESEKVAALLASRENLMRITETLMEAMAALPLVLNQEQYHNWRFQLCDFWSRIPPEACDDERDIYHLHETLLGRGLTFARSLPADVGEVSWSAYQGLFAEEDLASLLNYNVQLLHSARRGSVWGIRSLRDALAAARRDFAFASITLLGYRANEFSIVVLRSSGAGFVDRLKDVSWHLIRQAKAVSAIQTQYIKIAWPECSGLEAMAAKILEGAAALRLEPSWILLAIEPGLARVPWQDLLRRLGFRGGVALIPSAEWFVRVTRATHRRSAEKSAEVIVPLDADRFAALPAGGYDVSAADLCNEMRNDLGQLRKNFDDAIFVLGHGTWDPARHLTLFHDSAEPAEGDLLAPNLAKLSDKEIVVIHACSAGRVVLKTLGDFDGLAAACLARRTRAFLAPVAKVSAKTAQVLHQHLIATTTPSAPLGERYLAALEDDPRVALYTYYGLPWLAKGTLA